MLISWGSILPRYIANVLAEGEESTSSSKLWCAVSFWAKMLTLCYDGESKSLTVACAKAVWSQMLMICQLHKNELLSVTLNKAEWLSA